MKKPWLFIQFLQIDKISVHFRDKDEMLGTLTAEKRKEISLREASTHHRPASSMYSRKEKALKIYTHNDIVPNTNTSSRDDRGGASNYQANDLD